MPSNEFAQKPSPETINRVALQRAEIMYEKLLKIEFERHYDHGWSFYQLKEKFGEAVANSVWKKDDEYEPW